MNITAVEMAPDICALTCTKYYLDAVYVCVFLSSFYFRQSGSTGFASILRSAVDRVDLTDGQQRMECVVDLMEDIPFSRR
jgi:hypothetical protein